MELARIKVNGVRAWPVEVRDIPQGIIGGTVRFEFTDPMWESLTKIVVFRGFVTRDVVNAGDEVMIPVECIPKASVSLFVGVYGTDADGRIAIPTLWADLGRVRAAADPSGDPAADPALPIWAQLQADMEELKKQGASDEQIAQAVSDYLAENPVQTGATPEQAKQIQKNAEDIQKLQQNGGSGMPGSDGEDGATFMPALAVDGTLSWSNDKGLKNPDPVNIMGPQGEKGPAGEDGYTPVRGEDYWTPADVAEIKSYVDNSILGNGGSGGKAGFVVKDTPPEDTSVLWIDPTDNTADVPEASGGKSVTKYVNPAEVPLENGAQYIFYAAEGCTITITIGTYEEWAGSNKAEFQLATRNSVLWFLWTQTDEDGSLIPTHGDRGYFVFEGDCSKMKVSATTQYNYVVLKVS